MTVPNLSERRPQDEGIGSERYRSKAEMSQLFIHRRAYGFAAVVGARVPQDVRPASAASAGQSTSTWPVLAKHFWAEITNKYRFLRRE